MIILIFFTWAVFLQKINYAKQIKKFYLATNLCNAVNLYTL